MIPFSITDTVVAAGIISSELHKLPADAWIESFPLTFTDAFANSAFSKSPDSVELFYTGVEELDKRNIIRRHTRDGNLLQWKRPNYKEQFALCKDDAGVKDGLVRANADLMAQIDAEAKQAAAESAKAEADLAKAEADVAKAEADLAKAEADVAKAEADVAKAEADVAKADADVAKAEADVAKAETDVAKEKADVAKAVADVAKADADVAKAVANVAKAVANVAKAVANVAKAEARRPL
jgi:chromosome segregation ATPase